MGLVMLAASAQMHGESLLAAAAAQSSAVLWYLTRTTAVAAYVVLTLSVFFGLLRSVAQRSGERLSWVTDELHQVLASCFGALVLLHLITLYFHTFVPFTLANFLLPGDQPYRPFAVNLGVVALYTLIVVLASSWFRRSIPYRYWRKIHYLSFATLVLVTLHGLLSGSDTGEAWMVGLYAGVSASLGFILAVRFFIRPQRQLPTEEWEELPQEGEQASMPAPKKLTQSKRGYETLF